MLTSMLPLLPPPPPLPPGARDGRAIPSSSEWSLSATTLHLIQASVHATAQRLQAPPTAAEDALEPEEDSDTLQHEDDDNDDDDEEDEEEDDDHHNGAGHDLDEDVDEDAEEDADDALTDQDDDDAEPTHTATSEQPSNPFTDRHAPSLSRAPSPSFPGADDAVSSGPFLALNAYSPFFAPSSSPSVSSTCDCHRASQSRLSSVVVAPACSLLGFAATPSSSSASANCSRPSCSLLSALSSLRQSDKMTDVCFIVGGSLIDESKEESKDFAVDGGSPSVERIHAHRTVLSARSSVFDRMFDNGRMLESTHRRSVSSGSIDAEEDGGPLQVAVPDITPRAFRLMLDFIYLDHVPSAAMSEKHAEVALHYPSLLYASIKYDLPRLQGAVRTALHTVIPSIACPLWQSLLAMREDDLADKYHLHIMQHAATLIKTDGFLALPYSLLLQLIQDDRLQVSELPLFKALYQWMERRTEGSTGLAPLLECKEESSTERVQRQFKQQLLPFVRFPLMTARELAVHIAPTRLLSDAELAALFIHISSNAQTPAPPSFNANPRVACPSIVSLAYHHDGDEHGLVYWLGTHGYTQPFSNPHLSQRCAITLSSIQFGQPSSLTSRRRDVQLWTHNRPSSWVELDIDPSGSGVLLVPSHVSLQHGYDRSLDCLTSWTLEASTDRWEWDTLLEKRGVVAFREGYERRTWALPVSVVKAYRMFRIRGTGKDSSERTEYVCLGGVELYGELQVTQQPQHHAALRKRDDEEHKQGQGEKRQREEPAMEERSERRAVERPAAAAVADNANDPAHPAPADGTRASDVTAVVDEERRCWKAARQCSVM